MSYDNDSSDSDDCYGNIAQKLQCIKNKFEVDCVKSVNIICESAISKNVPETLENDTKTTGNVLKDESISLNDSEEIDLDLIIAQNSKKRPRRSNRIPTENTAASTTNTSRRGRKKANNTPPTSGSSKRGRKSRSSTNISEFVPTVNRPQRHRNQRGRPRTQCLIDSLPIYSVGNTDEYPDNSDSVQLFNKKSDDVVIIDDEQTEDVEELSVKIYWQSTEIVKFMLRKYQKFTTIYDYFSNKENISKNQLFFTYNDKVISIEDTPDSINYNIGKFIDGGILNQDVRQLVRKSKKGSSENGLKLKFQCMSLKKPYEMLVEKDERFHIAMVKFAEHLEIGLDKLKFYFDGDLINGKLTPDELDLEGGECIDVKIAN